METTKSSHTLITDLIYLFLISHLCNNCGWHVFLWIFRGLRRWWLWWRYWRWGRGSVGLSVWSAGLSRAIPGSSGLIAATSWRTTLTTTRSTYPAIIIILRRSELPHPLPGTADVLPMHSEHVSVMSWQPLFPQFTTCGWEADEIIKLLARWSRYCQTIPPWRFFSAKFGVKCLFYRNICWKLVDHANFFVLDSVAYFWRFWHNPIL